MTDKKDSQDEQLTRRGFLCGAAATTAAVACVSLLGSNALGQQQSTETRALDDPSITHGRVEFKSGDHMVDGYLARPLKKGRYPAVVVLP